MRPINVCYFALLREKADVEQEVVHTSTQTYAELYEELSQKYHFGLPASMIQVAVNDEFSLMTETLLSNSKVVFIPPVAGG
jgi:molybdopterin synthase sulfur carrier subunit